MLLLDTDVMIDLSRDYPPAVEWFDGLTERPALVGQVVLELLRGARNKQEMARIRKSLRPFRIYWPTEADCNRALETYAHAHLSHSLGAQDVLIGECAVGLGATFCTFNEKHYRAIPGLALLRPYAKV